MLVRKIKIQLKEYLLIKKKKNAGKEFFYFFYLIFINIYLI
jgi:hypothetical protein